MFIFLFFIPFSTAIFFYPSFVVYFHPLIPLFLIFFPFHFFRPPSCLRGTLLRSSFSPPIVKALPNLSVPDTFNGSIMSLPVFVDPASKKVSYEEGFLDSLSSADAQEYQAAVDDLNNLNRKLVELPGDVPPPPQSVTAASLKTQNAPIYKLRDAGIQSLKHGKNDSVKLLTQALDLSLKKAPWDSAGVNIEELASILGPRADAYISQNLWPEAFADASLMVLLKGNESKNHIRKARCLMRVERNSEAKSELNIALALTPGESTAKNLLKELE